MQLHRKIERRIIAGAFIVVFVFMAVSPALLTDAVDVSSNINVGPYVDKVVFKVIPDRDQMSLALMSGEIDLATRHLLPANLASGLEENPDISIYRALRNGYGHITINCGKYPLNISGFRRAFAYAFDKERVRVEIFEGESQLHDSVVPYVQKWCIEDDFPYHYYTARPDIGNQILDDLGFDIHPVTGYRTAPDGSPFRVEILWPSISEEVAGPSAHLGVDVLHSLHIDAEAQAVDFSIILGLVDNHEDYDMAFWGYAWYWNDPLWLTDYWSEYVDVHTRNPSNFENASYDLLCEELLTCMTESEAMDIVADMQLILHENVPLLVVYENIYVQAYRNDVFTGHVPDVNRYIAGPWTLRKIHRIDGEPGGTVNVGYHLYFNTFNIFRPFSAGLVNILVWPSLYEIGPDLNLVPSLAENLIMETHSDNEDVFEGNTRFTIDIIQNATWSDGTPITATDVAGTYTYLYETAEYGNPGSVLLGEFVSAYAPTTYRAIIEFNSESMWHMNSIALGGVLPAHIFDDEGEVTPARWNFWNPVFDLDEPYVTCGPFVVTDFEVGEFCELTANPLFPYYPEFDDPTTTTTTTPPITTDPFNFSLALTGGAVGAASTVLVGGFFLFRIREPIAV
jgi:ABC-type transport system substrate-binding protein